MRKERTVKLLKRCLLLASVLMMMFSCTAFASPKSKAFKAYKKYLSKSKVYVMPKGYKWYTRDFTDYRAKTYKGTKASKVKFAFAYIDNDNVPELILTDAKWGSAIYKYMGGKVTCVDHVSFYDKYKGYYKKSGLIYRLHTSEGTPYTDNYEKLEGNVLNKVCYIEHDSEYDPPMYHLTDWQEVSKAEFNAARAQAAGGKKYTKFKFYSNTAANRKKLK